MASKPTPDVHLNLNVRGMPHSATVAINERSNALKAEGRDVFKLGLGQSPFPVPESVVASLREHAHEKDYLPVTGLRPLREAVARYHNVQEGLDRTAADVLIGPGSKELMFLLQMVFYGDLVIPTPAWVSYAPQARIIGRTVRLIETDRDDNWRLTPQRLEQLCEEDEGRPRIVIFNYPANPTGTTYTTAELRELAKVAKAHKVLMLSDEIYGELHHKGQHVSIARFYPEGTIISAGLSKWCGAGGWRLGTFVFPSRMRWLLDAMAAAASETYTSTSAPIQYAAVRAFEGGRDIEQYLQLSRRVLSGLGRWCTKQIEKAGGNCPTPTGAFYLFPDFEAHRAKIEARGITTSAQLCEQLLEDTGVAILPGSEFGRPKREFTVRMAYVDFDGGEALQAAAGRQKDQGIDEVWLREHCPRVTTAIDRLCEWVQA